MSVMLCLRKLQPIEQGVWHSAGGGLRVWYLRESQQRQKGVWRLANQHWCSLVLCGDAACLPAHAACLLAARMQLVVAAALLCTTLFTHRLACLLLHSPTHLVFSPSHAPQAHMALAVPPSLLPPPCSRAIKTDCGPYSELARLCGLGKSAAELTAFAQGKQQEFEQVRPGGGGGGSWIALRHQAAKHPAVWVWACACGWLLAGYVLKPSLCPFLPHRNLKPTHPSMFPPTSPPSPPLQCRTATGAW